MTRADLTEKVSAKNGLKKREVEKIINVIFEGITEALGKGDKVEVRGFGSFRIRHRASRNGRNPKTGEHVSVPSKKIPFFKAGKDLKEMVNRQAVTE